jgi:AraC-like DNA-binding protein
MARIAALLPRQSDRSFLQIAALPDELLWADNWRELNQIVRAEPVAAAVADLHAEAGKDGVLRVFRFSRRFPLTPLVVWGTMDGRELFRLGKAGAADVLLSADTHDRVLVREVLASVLRDGLGSIIDDRLLGRVHEEARELARFMADRVPDRVQVPEIGASFGMSVSTLERRCEGWGLPSPGRLLLWMRVLCGLRWLLEPGRSVESVAVQLGYSSGAAFRRAIKATIGGRPTPLRNYSGFDRSLEQFLAECPGDITYRKLVATG